VAKFSLTHLDLREKGMGFQETEMSSAMQSRCKVFF
jgi:hypothetical protein